MLAISLTPIEIACLQALDADRRPVSAASWSRAVDALRRLASIGLIAFRDGLITYSNEIEVTNLGKTTLEMKRRGDFEKVCTGGVSWYSFYY